jgi:hypothetical protein
MSGERRWRGRGLINDVLGKKVGGIFPTVEGIEGGNMQGRNT